jgi:hypothetical protein
LSHRCYLLATLKVANISYDQNKGKYCHCTCLGLATRTRPRDELALFIKGCAMPIGAPMAVAITVTVRLASSNKIW